MTHIQHAASVWPFKSASVFSFWCFLFSEDTCEIHTSVVCYIFYIFYIPVIWRVCDADVFFVLRRYMWNTYICIAHTHIHPHHTHTHTSASHTRQNTGIKHIEHTTSVQPFKWASFFLFLCPSYTEIRVQCIHLHHTHIHKYHTYTQISNLYTNITHIWHASGVYSSTCAVK